MKITITYKITALLVLTILFFNTSTAQGEGRYIKAAIGLGISAPEDETDVTGTGFYAQGEYVMNLTSWFGVRPYAGVIITSPDDESYVEGQPRYEVTSKAFLIGAKARIMAPIPYVAPYLESGIGLSAGSFRTYTAYVDKETSDILLHIPFTLGLAVGKRHNFDIAFTYYFHPSADQFSGAAAFGFTFPIGAHGAQP